MQTIEKHLESIKNKIIREQALKNMTKEYAQTEELLLSEAIFGAFVWDTSPEGHEYWNKIYEQAQGGINNITSKTITAKEIADDVQQTFDDVSASYRTILEKRIEDFGKQCYSEGYDKGGILTK